MAAGAGARRTARLRLEPICPEHAHDLWRLHQDEAVAAWHGGPWSTQVAQDNAAAMARAGAADGVGKWIADALDSGEPVGRGGLARLDPAAELTARIGSLLAGGGWGRDRLELGWTVRSELWGQGYATEIGRAGLALAFEELGAEEMERLGMRQAGEFRARGLVEGRAGVHEGAPFSLYVRARGG
jgi:RimJ/RimL family protein N-acetyltransferase